MSASIVATTKYAVHGASLECASKASQVLEGACHGIWYQPIRLVDFHAGTLLSCKKFLAIDLQKTPF